MSFELCHGIFPFNAIPLRASVETIIENRAKANVSLGSALLKRTLVYTEGKCNTAGIHKFRIKS